MEDSCEDPRNERPGAFGHSNSRLGSVGSSPCQEVGAVDLVAGSLPRRPRGIRSAQRWQDAGPLGSSYTLHTTAGELSVGDASLVQGVSLGVRDTHRLMT